ncbi:MAG: VCBS repeat-containing protein, partial [Pseudomonadota bacterium]
MPKTVAGVAACVLMTMVHTAAAQWVTFTDETATRLTLTPFNDAPQDDPLFDAEEKDLVTADFDQDGWIDVIAVRKEPFSNPGARQDVLLMNEDGALVDRTSLYAPGFLSTPTDARDVVVADIDQDGWLDIVIANTFEQQPLLYRNAGLDEFGVWQGLVDESAQRLPVLNVPADVSTVQFCAVAAGDITDDGYPELYFANYVPIGGTTDVLLENDGSGHSVIATQARLGDYAVGAGG